MKSSFDQHQTKEHMAPEADSQKQRKTDLKMILNSKSLKRVFGFYTYMSAENVLDQNSSLQEVEDDIPGYGTRRYDCCHRPRRSCNG